MEQHDQDIKRGLKRWVAAVDAADRRDEVEASLGIEFADGTPVEATRINDDGDATGHMDLRVDRQTLPSGGLKFTVMAPAAGKGGEIERVWFSGRNRENRMARVAVPAGRIEDGRVDIVLSEKAVKNCPIDITKAIPFSAEVRLMSWFEQLVADGAKVVHDLFDAPVPTLQQRSLAAAAADNVMPLFGPEDTWVYEDEVLSMRLSRIVGDEVVVSFEACSDELDGAMVAFPVNSEQTEIAYVVLSMDASGAPPSAKIVCREDELAFSDAKLPVVLDQDEWTEAAVVGLQWSLDHAGSEALAETLADRISEAQTALAEVDAGDGGDGA